MNRRRIVEKLTEYMFAGDVLLPRELMERLEQGAWMKDLVDAKKLASST